MRIVNLIEGYTGFLGHALFSHCPVRSSGFPRKKLRQMVENPDPPVLRDILFDQLDEIVDEHDRSSNESALQINLLCAVGEIRSKAPLPTLKKANCDFPLIQHEIVQEWLASRHQQGLHLQYATFGSAFETIEEFADWDNYHKSKRQLFLEWKKQSGSDPQFWHHFQIHTLYGGQRIHPSMFSGMMEMALRSQCEFRMSDGMQLREYHHVEDIAHAVHARLQNPEKCGSPCALNSGEPVMLRELAQYVFNHFGKEELLKVGALPKPEMEVYENHFERTPDLTRYRDPRRGMVDWLREKGVGQS
jgi:hypothetical protein